MWFRRLNARVRAFIQKGQDATKGTSIPIALVGKTSWRCLPFLLLAVTNYARAEAIGRTDPNGGLFPDSSIVDFRFLLDAPAGKHGFLRVNKNGHFAWPNGKRAKFWGVNIANKSVFVDKATIDKVVDVLARAGTNMVRFEALDSFGGLLDTPGNDSTRTIDPAKLKTLDYWVSRVRAKGIYYYLDLLDFRQFKVGDGVPEHDRIGRAAKPYAFFDRRLIDLQKEFAQQLLAHKNAYTGLRYVDDPALALVEVCNEHGLFFSANRLETLVEPYGTAFRQQWNAWLLKRYGSRDGIRKAWGRIAEVDVLGPDEDPGSYSVRLPLFTAGVEADDTLAPLVVDVRRAPGRLRDGVRFLYEIQRDYFREMKAFLREIGLKIPITGVVSNEYIPDVASVAAEFDFTSENYYADHPAFAGKDWEGTFFYNDTNPLRASSVYQAAPWLAALRWENKPVVVREWATVWPNRYRAVAVPEMAAYAGLQDFDAVLLFGYQIAGSPEKLSDFDHQADPTVWGQYALGALSFLRGHVGPSLVTVTLQHSPETLFRWPNMIGSLHRLAWFVRLNSTYNTKPPAPSGSSPAPGSARLASRGPERKPAPAESLHVALWPGSTTVLTGVLDSLGGLGVPVSSRMLDAGLLRSGTAEVARDQKSGRLTVTTARTVALCGELPANKAVTVGPLTLVSPSRVGSLMAVSLDGKPLASSAHYLVKMVTRAENAGQSLAPAPPGAPARYRLADGGTGPVKTFGRAEGVTLLRRGSQPLLSLNLTDGVWELLVKNGRATLVCDTGGVRGTLFGQATKTVANQPVVVKARISKLAQLKSVSGPAR
jgi:hypothetical protein